MIGILRAILEALGRVLANQQDAAIKAQANADAIEHLRVLIEGDSIPTKVGDPTFTATGGNA